MVDLTIDNGNDDESGSIITNIDVFVDEEELGPPSSFVSITLDELASCTVVVDEVAPPRPARLDDNDDTDKEETTMTNNHLLTNSNVDSITTAIEDDLELGVAVVVVNPTCGTTSPPSKDPLVLNDVDETGSVATAATAIMVMRPPVATTVSFEEYEEPIHGMDTHNSNGGVAGVVRQQQHDDLDDFVIVVPTASTSSSLRVSLPPHSYLFRNGLPWCQCICTILSAGVAALVIVYFSLGPAK